MGTLFRKGKNMKTESSIAKIANSNTLTGRIRTACAVKLLPLLLLLLTLPVAVQAQWSYRTNNGTITIHWPLFITISLNHTHSNSLLSTPYQP